MKNFRELHLDDFLDWKERAFVDTIPRKIAPQLISCGKSVRVTTAIGDYFVWVEVNDSSFLNCMVMEYEDTYHHRLMPSTAALAYDSQLLEVLLDVKREAILLG